jgi:preprotein translocase subunit SecG
MLIYLQLSLIILSFVLIALVLLQARGSGFGSMFGSDAGVYKTRRGMEKTLFNMTVVCAALFLTISLLTVIVG